MQMWLFAALNIMSPTEAIIDQPHVHHRGEKPWDHKYLPIYYSSLVTSSVPLKVKSFIEHGSSEVYVSETKFQVAGVGQMLAWLGSALYLDIWHQMA